MQGGLQLHELAAGHQPVERRLLERDADAAAHLLAAGWRRRTRRPSRARRWGAAASTSIRTVVVLPAPLGPRKPYTSPGATSRSMPSTAFSPPLNSRSSPMTSIAAMRPCYCTCNFFSVAIRNNDGHVVLNASMHRHSGITSLVAAALAATALLPAVASAKITEMGLMADSVRGSCPGARPTSRAARRSRR